MADETYESEYFESLPLLAADSAKVDRLQDDKPESG